MEFPGWIDQGSINAYISRVRNCLLDDNSKQILNEHLPPEAIDLLFEKFAGRYRPAIVAIVSPFPSTEIISKKIE